MKAEILQMAKIDSALARARADFLEMPGLRLTAAQACRLWTLDPSVCHSVLSQLVASEFLTATSSQHFVRRAG